MNIVLIGFKKSGKTTLGKRLAQKLGWAFVDSDAQISAFLQKSCFELWQEDSKKFRIIENRIIVQLAKLDRHVIALGGGSVEEIENWHALYPNALFLYLKTSKVKIWQRLIDKNAKNFIACQNEPLKYFEKLWQSRCQKYEEIADGQQQF